MLLYVFSAIIIVATLIDRSPMLLLSGLGAMSAVILLVYKDTLLSFVASVQLTNDDLLRVGDWIEMPQVGADGDVVDITLHTVKVQNFDKTIVSIPTWRFDVRVIQELARHAAVGGRRIKRSLFIDASDGVPRPMSRSSVWKGCAYERLPHHRRKPNSKAGMKPRATWRPCPPTAGA